MKGTQCLNNSRRALYRVFVSPLESSTTLRSSFNCTTQLGQSWRPNVPTHLPLSNVFGRGLSTTATRFALPPRKQRAVPDRLPIDFEIRAKDIMLLEENNEMTGPHKTQRLLATMDVSTYSLRMIEDSLPPPKPSDDGKPQRPRRPNAQYPLCRIVHKANEYKAEQAKAKAKKEAGNVGKQKGVEINWAIAQNDLALKLKQLRTFLEKGHKVIVTFARKKGTRVATGAEIEAVVKSVQAMVAEVPGAKEYKPSDGEKGRKFFLHYEGKVVPASKPTTPSD